MHIKLELVVAQRLGHQRRCNNSNSYNKKKCKLTAEAEGKTIKKIIYIVAKIGICTLMVFLETTVTVFDWNSKKRANSSTVPCHNNPTVSLDDTQPDSETRHTVTFSVCSSELTKVMTFVKQKKN